MEHLLPRRDKPTLDLSEYVTATVYCAAKGISPPTLYRMLKKGMGPETVRVSNNCRLFRLPQDEHSRQRRTARIEQTRHGRTYTSCSSDAEGFTASLSGNSHWRIIPPSLTTPIFAASTPSDRLTLLKLRAEIGRRMPIQP